MSKTRSTEAIRESFAELFESIKVNKYVMTKDMYKTLNDNCNTLFRMIDNTSSTIEHLKDVAEKAEASFSKLETCILSRKIVSEKTNDKANVKTVNDKAKAKKLVVVDESDTEEEADSSANEQNNFAIIKKNVKPNHKSSAVLGYKAIVVGKNSSKSFDELIASHKKNYPNCDILAEMDLPEPNKFWNSFIKKHEQELKMNGLEFDLAEDYSTKDMLKDINRAYSRL